MVHGQSKDSVRHVSIKSLVRRTHDTSHFAAIGALLMVLATTLDSFFQQIVQFELGTLPNRDMPATALAAYEWNGLSGQISLFSNAGQ